MMTWQSASNVFNYKWRVWQSPLALLYHANMLTAGVQRRTTEREGRHKIWIGSAGYAYAALKSRKES